MRRALSFIAAIVPLIALAATPPTAPAPVEAAAPTRLLDALPSPVRQLLKPRMSRHIGDLTGLRALMRKGDWASVAARAGAIADEPTIARPVPGNEDALNSQLPERFFALQDELRRHARALKRAALRGEEPQIKRAFDDLSLTCLRCHGHFGPPPHRLPETLEPPSGTH